MCISELQSKHKRISHEEKQTKAEREREIGRKSREKRNDIVFAENSTHTAKERIQQINKNKCCTHIVSVF